MDASSGGRMLHAVARLQPVVVSPWSSFAGSGAELCPHPQIVKSRRCVMTYHLGDSSIRDQSRGLYAIDLTPQ